jgi:nucleotide-binding universal stress UspA family protein
MTVAGGDGSWKLLAVVDLLRPDAHRAVENALTLAGRLHAELSLLSVIEKHLYERGLRYLWPKNAFGRESPEVDIHRVMLPGTPAEVLAGYADHIGANLLVIPAEYRVRRWLKGRSLAQAVAALTSRPLWIVPPAAGRLAAEGPLRAGCLVRLNAADDGLCTAAQSVLERCSAEIVTHVIEDRSEAALMLAAVEKDFGLIVARRGEMLSLIDHLPCPVLSVPVSAISTAKRVLASKSVATA